MPTNAPCRAASTSLGAVSATWLTAFRNSSTWGSSSLPAYLLARPHKIQPKAMTNHHYLRAKWPTKLLYRFTGLLRDLGHHGHEPLHGRGKLTLQLLLEVGPEGPQQGSTSACDLHRGSIHLARGLFDPLQPPLEALGRRPHTHYSQAALTTDCRTAW